MAGPCPFPSDLLRLVRPDAASASDRGRIARHVADCETCRQIVSDLRDQVAFLAGATQAEAEPGADCLGPDTIAALADSTISMEDRSAAVGHLATCARCRAELAEVCATLRDPDVAATRRRSGLPRVRTLVAGLGLLAAAAAAILVVAVHRQRVEPAPQLRDDALPARVPVVLAPRGGISAPPVFRWSSVPGADRYHLTVFTNDGTIVWESETVDTTITTPVTTQWHHDVNYFWKVAARTAFDRWSGSRMIEFHLTSGRLR
jgi:anti-sigma factor RsiW